MVTTAIVGVLIIWFSLGLFPIHPTMVASSSMRPVMDVGDVAIVEKAPADSVRESDIKATFSYQFSCNRPVSEQSEEVEVTAIVESPVDGVRVSF